MIAAQYHTDAVDPLLKQIATLPPVHQIDIFKQRSKDGYNCLMLAAQCQPKAITPLLAEIANFPEANTNKADKIAFFTQLTSRSKYNCLMLAVLHQPEAVSLLLAEIAKLPQEKQIAIFTQLTSSKNYNCLMLAARCQPAAVSPLLTQIATLPPVHQIAIFKQLSVDNDNCLTVAARYQPAAVAPLLKQIESLAPEDQNFFLKNKTIVQLLGASCVSQKKDSLIELLTSLFKISFKAVCFVLLAYKKADLNTFEIQKNVCLETMLQLYIARREAEQREYLRSGLFKGISRTDKLAAADQLLCSLDPQQTTSRAPNPSPALRQGDLGKIYRLLH
jgi:hypothetical protein